MKKFSREWKSSKKPRKQRNYRLNSPLHIKQKFTHVHLSKDLRRKFGKRSISLRKGDKVKVMKGKFHKYEGKVEKVDLRRSRVFIAGIEAAKKDGTKKMIALHPSNLMITDINTDDKFRQKLLERK